jgi:hypothetical protein
MGSLPAREREIGNLMAMLNAADESIPGHHAGFGERRADDFNNFLASIVCTSESTQRLQAFARRPSLAAQVTDVDASRSGMINRLARSFSEHIERRLALSPSVWLAIMDPTQSTTQHLLRRQSRKRNQTLSAAI